MHEPPTGRRIRRFTNWQMAIHWTTAYASSSLAITGLIILFGKNVLLPLIGYTLFSWLAILAKNLHNFVGPLFFVCIAAAVLHVRPRQFLARATTGTGSAISAACCRSHDVPSGKFNAGEKLWFWGGVLLLGADRQRERASCSTSRTSTRRATRCRSPTSSTSIVASLFMLAALGHIYMGTLGMAGAYDAMSTGYVDETWAKEHHLYWYNDVKAGKIPTAPDDAPAPLVAPRAG